MTEVWKVVREINQPPWRAFGLLQSAIVYCTEWGRMYEKGIATTFPKSAPGLAFDQYECAKKFMEGRPGLSLQIWKAKAKVLSNPVKSILPYHTMAETLPGPYQGLQDLEDNTIAAFWKSDRWQRGGDKRIHDLQYIPCAPPGTVACLSITLLERCDD